MRLSFDSSCKYWCHGGEPTHVRDAPSETRESNQTFNIWVYGDKTLARGSGLFVGHSGVVCNHHFLLPDDGTSYQFLAGGYVVDVYATLVGDRKPRLLSSFELTVSESLAGQLRTPEAGMYFDWGPDSGAYHAHAELKAGPAIPPLRSRTASGQLSPQ